MQFDSFLFLAFFVSVLGAYHVLPNWRRQKQLLLVASYLFYAAWSPPLVVLVWISTVVDFLVARVMARQQDRLHRRALLLVSLVVNLGLLGYFKYAEFLVTTFADVVATLGIHYQPPALDIILPIGISFYTFQTLSYTIDVYRGRIAATDSWLDFALYVTFFPQLVAGPIVRAGDFLPQCEERRIATPAALGWGLTLMVFGIFGKIVLADNLLAPVADQVYAAPENYGSLDAGIGMLAFSGQIFFDFASYSLCAIGAALCFGFSLPDNFRSPYAAIGFSDFWSRWHISLSGWLRDYLYVPLGGNRAGATRTAANLGLTMFLGGLWHGAAWTFVIWGWLHGLLLVAEHGLRRWFSGWVPGPVARVGLALMTFLAVTLAWVPFRAQGFDNLVAMLTAISRPEGSMSLATDTRVLVVSLLAGTVAWHGFTRHVSLEHRIAALPLAARAFLIAILLVAVVLGTSGDTRAFIYFQF